MNLTVDMLPQLEVINKWVDAQLRVYKTKYPHVSDEELRAAITNIAKKKINDREVTVHNNHLKQRQKMPMSKLMTFIETQKPIISGYGVMYLDQNKMYNPSAKMLEGFQTNRDNIKGRLKVLAQGTYEYALADLQQNNEKVCVNSYYGSCGAPTSRFYNIYNAASATITGQIIISTASQVFEGFLSNNVAFFDLDDCVEFIMAVTEPHVKYTKLQVPDVELETVMQRLIANFNDYKDNYDPILRSYVESLSQEDLNRLYYRNNFYEFTNIPEVRSMIRYIFSNTSPYILPQCVPDEIHKELEYLWLCYRDYVYHNHSPKSRIQRLRNNVRNAVIVVDTDSNIIHIQNQIDYIYNDICGDIDVVQNQNYDDMEMTIANVICYMMSEVVELILADLTQRCNLLPDYGALVQMKNEFLASTIMTTRNKKWYGLISKLREGVLLDPPKVTIKGMSFIKSTTNDVTKKHFENLVKQRVLLPSRKVDVVEILSDVRRFENLIAQSLDEGEVTFASPHKTKDIEAYTFPDRIQSVRASIAWNAVYPDQPIQPPDRIQVIKVKMDTLEDIEDLKDDEPEIYQALVKGVFNHPKEEIAKKGINVFAIPNSVSKIPEWIRPYIDKEKIIDDNIKLGDSVMHAMGLSTADMSRSEVTNIIRVGSEGLLF